MDKPIGWLKYISEKYGFWPMFAAALLLVAVIAAGLYFGLPVLDWIK